jgi:tRNA (guanine37-N1)-methyltransferase
MIKIDVITIFPDIFDDVAGFGVIKEAFKKNLCQLNIYNLRDFSDYKHGRIDDRPYGGGSGMILMPEPLDRAITFIKKKNKIKNIREKQKTVLLTPGGERLNQTGLKYLSKLENVILICGRYEGIDQRVVESLVDLELSIGDYVLTGGEIPAMVIIDGVLRLLPGVVGKEESLKTESFEDNLLDYPQYTRPEVFKGVSVPRVLLSGDHKKIKKWRKERSLEITRKRRPDLFDKDS